jgi:hypothetical protein
MYKLSSFYLCLFVVGIRRTGAENMAFEKGSMCDLILDDFKYNKEPPSRQAVVDLYKPWASILPDTPHGEKLVSNGGSGLFDDHRIKLLLGIVQVNGTRVLELGPLEGGHSYMLSRAGAHVVAIEGSPLAYTKLLAVNEIYGLKHVQFLYGNFIAFVKESVEKKRKFHAVICVGVLYHMTDPMELLFMLSQITDNILIWTQYYNPKILLSYIWLNDDKPITVGGYTHTPHKHKYDSRGKTFLGGQDPVACWLERKDILGGLAMFGFNKFHHLEKSIPEEENHPHGSQFTFLARRVKDDFFF